MAKIHVLVKQQDASDKGWLESYTGYGDKVLELPAGMTKQLDIKKGDTVSFSLF